MMERELEEKFIAWVRRELAETEIHAGRQARITAMREAGGVDYRQAEAQSVAYQVEFDSIDEARRWSSEKFSTLAARFEEAFGPQAMVFTSIFEVV